MRLIAIALASGLALSACRSPESHVTDYPQGLEAGLGAKTIVELQAFVRPSFPACNFETRANDEELDFAVAAGNDYIYAGTCERADYGNDSWDATITSIAIRRRPTVEQQVGRTLPPQQRELVELVETVCIGEYVTDIDVRRLMEAAAYAHGLIDGEVLDALTAVIEARQSPILLDPYRSRRNDWFAALLVARLVFEPKTYTPMELPAILGWGALTEASHELHSEGMPLFPIVEQDGIPFVLWLPGNMGGHPGDVSAYLNYCRSYCHKRRPLSTPGDNPLVSAEALIKRVESLAAQESLARWAWALDYAPQMIRLQALVALNLRSIEAAGRGNEVGIAEWRDELSRHSHRSLRWDEEAFRWRVK